MGYSREVKSIGIILLMVILAHGLNILNDGIYSDGWMIYHHIHDMDYDKLRLISIDVGLPEWGSYYYWVLAKLGDVVFVSRIATFIAIGVVSIAVYYFLRQLRLFSERETVICCIVAAVYSAYQMEVNIIMAFSTFCLMCFYVGIALYQYSMGQNGGLKAWLLQIVSMILLFMSFNLNSLLVYYYGLLLIVHHYAGMLRWRELKRLAISRHAIMYIIPIAYWIMKVALYPKASYFDTYNEFIRNPVAWGVGLFKFLMNAVNAQISLGMSNLLIYPLMFVGAFFLAKKLQSIDDESPADARSLTPNGVIAVGGWLFLFSVGAYVLVGKSPSIDGWDSRMSILVSLSVGVVVIGMMRYVMNSVTRDVVGKRIVMFIVASMIFGFVMTNWKNSIAWELNWIRDVALMEQLHVSPEWKGNSIYAIRDDTEFPDVVRYHAVAYAGILKRVWGGESRVGLNPFPCQDYDVKKQMDILSQSKKALNWIMISEFDPEGESVGLRIRRRGDLQNHTIFAKYYYYKYFRPELMADFLRTVFSIDRIPLDEACRS